MDIYEDLLLEKRNGIATITLNAPDKMNAFTSSMRENIPLAVDDIAKDDEVKAVIVTGAGRAFCAGGDVELMKARIDGNLEESRYQHLQYLVSVMNN
ncbi:MAG: enoyl-CoA hydratase/isomerase family protein [Dehalococcoidales bacterium]|nr:enoyl-CoA hydratase/isomerase family protein [Dehalococcoidales bacterium]